MGKFLALALMNDQVLPLVLHRHVIKFLLDRPLRWHDLAFMDPEAFESLRRLLVLASEGDGSAVDETGLTFSYTPPRMEGAGEVELVPGGSEIAVTRSNVHEYVHRYALARLRFGQPAMEAMRRGLVALIPQRLLRILNAEDMWLMLNGGSGGVVEVAKLRQLINFRDTRDNQDGGSADDFAQLFWSVLEDLTDAERARFLYFCTGWSRLPADPNAAGINLRINIAPNSTRLPRAQSCFKDCTIPFYDSKDTFKAKLIWALQADSYELS